MDLLFSLWCSSCDVIYFMICWSVSVTYVNLISRICRMGMNMSDCDVWSGMMSFFVLMTCGVVDVVCHGRIDGYNSCMQNLSIMSYFCGGGDYPYVMIWNGFYMDYVNLTCSVCGNVTVIWNGFSCPCLCSSVWSLT